MITIEGALRDLLDAIPAPPERNCSCHIAPPCHDCVEYAALREAIGNAEAALCPDEDKPGRPRATELEYLTWFRHAADFGPAEGDVIDDMNQRFMQETGKNLPEGWNWAQDGETSLDRED
jgi:hypothetical protein